MGAHEYVGGLYLVGIIKVWERGSKVVDYALDPLVGELKFHPHRANEGMHVNGLVLENFSCCLHPIVGVEAN